MSEHELDLSIYELEKLMPKFKRAQELPETFTATVTGIAVQEDKTGRKCVFLTLELDDGSQTKIKYTPMHFATFVSHLVRLKVKNLSELRGRKLVFKREGFRIGYPRHFPAQEVKDK